VKVVEERGVVEVRLVGWIKAVDFGELHSGLGAPFERLHGYGAGIVISTHHERQPPDLGRIGDPQPLVLQETQDSVSAARLIALDAHFDELR
jgi:hypothetical protein